jgi:hypothetical protein
LPEPWSFFGGAYRFRYYEGNQAQEKFNRSLALKISDVRSPIWRGALIGLRNWRILPRSYVWGLADIVRTGLEGRAYSTYAFGRLTFMQPRPLIFPGYIAVRLPIALTLLSCFGCVVLLKQSISTQDKLAVCALLALSTEIIIILARSGADYAGISTRQ